MPWRVASKLRLTPYLVTTATACLVVLAAWGLIDLLLAPERTVVIQVVPLPEDGQIRVKVDGGVINPGVYLLPPGSTRGDAIEAAGGYAEAAIGDGESGQVLTDGDILIVSQVAEASSDSTRPVNINTADAGQLETLPGIGPVLAGRIVSYREQHGPFSEPLDLVAVSGISERMVAELQGLITVEQP